jgi:pyruvate/2-oxoglutarate dehydrogenase complex dihydrolipoamide dehydrogenase (E3) component
LKHLDADLSEALSAGLARRGIRIFAQTKLQRVEKAAVGKRVFFQHGEQEHTIEAEEIVYALGRQPATGALHPADAGVDTDHAGFIRVNHAQQSSVPHIFAAGDVCGPHEIVHLAVQQGEIAARNAARLIRQSGDGLEKMDYTLKLFAIFSHPEVAMVGLTAREAKERGLDYTEASYPFADHGKAMVDGETDGFVKLLAAGPERRIIGGSVIGPSASELIHEIVVAMRFGATAAQLAAIPHYHPTLSEIWTYPAEELAKP